MKESESDRRRRLINLGELIAIAALIVSALGVWVSWRNSTGSDSKPPQASEQRQPVPLVLRAKRQDDGRQLEISPVEDGQALQSLRITVAGAAPIEVGSDGDLNASDVETALKAHENEPKDQRLSVPARIETRYVEAGKDRKATGTYTLRYVWKGGGLFGSRSLQLVSLSR
jgi:hypothetical protein